MTKVEINVYEDWNETKEGKQLVDLEGKEEISDSEIEERAEKTLEKFQEERKQHEESMQNFYESMESMVTQVAKVTEGYEGVKEEMRVIQNQLDRKSMNPFTGKRVYGIKGIMKEYAGITAIIEDIIVEKIISSSVAWTEQDFMEGVIERIRGFPRFENIQFDDEEFREIGMDDVVRTSLERLRVLGIIHEVSQGKYALQGSNLELIVNYAEERNLDVEIEELKGKIERKNEHEETIQKNKMKNQEKTMRICLVCGERYDSWGIGGHISRIHSIVSKKLPENITKRDSMTLPVDKEERIHEIKDQVKSIIDGMDSGDQINLYKEMDLAMDIEGMSDRYREQIQEVIDNYLVGRESSDLERSWKLGEKAFMVSK